MTRAVRVFVKQIGVEDMDGSGPESGEKRAYDAIVARVSEQLRRTQDRGADALNNALDRAQEVTRTAGEFTSEQIDRASGYVRRDLFQPFREPGNGLQNCFHNGYVLLV